MSYDAATYIEYNGNTFVAIYLRYLERSVWSTMIKFNRLFEGRRWSLNKKQWQTFFKLHAYCNDWNAFSFPRLKSQYNPPKKVPHIKQINLVKGVNELSTYHKHFCTRQAFSASSILGRCWPASAQNRASTKCLVGMEADSPSTVRCWMQCEPLPDILRPWIALFATNEAGQIEVEAQRTPCLADRMRS